MSTFTGRKSSSSSSTSLSRPDEDFSCGGTGGGGRDGLAGFDTSFEAPLDSDAGGSGASAIAPFLCGFFCVALDLGGSNRSGVGCNKKVDLFQTTKEEKNE
jgi:hypothetical protein